MKFGVFSVSMPEYGIEETAALLAELGYDGVEWRVQAIPDSVPEVPWEARYWGDNKSTLDLGKIDREVKRAKAVCDEKGIEIFGLTTYLTPGRPKEVETVLAAAKSIGCGMVRVFPPAYDEKESYPALFSRTAEELRELEKLAGKYGVKIVMEIHMDNILASPSAARRLLEGIDPARVGLIFDPGNMVYEGFENYKKSFEMLGDYIAHVHVKNAAIVEDGADELGALKFRRQWMPLKKGMADLKNLFRVMKEMGYDGTVSVEDFSNEENTRDKLEGNLAYIRQLAESVK